MRNSPCWARNFALYHRSSKVLSCPLNITSHHCENFQKKIEFVMLGPFPLTLSESPAGNDWFSRLHLCHHHAQPPRADVCPGPSPRLPHRARRPGPDVRGPTGS